jgi:hypothetical protein
LATLESASSSGHILRLVLEQTGDRVSHRIEVLDADSRILAELRSIEGTSDDEWPASPVLQNCSLQEIRPGALTAFLVGMAGKSHWSASIETVPHTGAFNFDFACRVHEEPQWMGTTYIQSISPHSRFTLFELSPEGIAIRTYDSFDSTRRVQMAEQLLLITCGEKPVKFPATLRWRYRIYLEDAVLPPLPPDLSMHHD